MPETTFKKSLEIDTNPKDFPDAKITPVNGTSGKMGGIKSEKEQMSPNMNRSSTGGRKGGSARKRAKQREG